MSSKPLLRMATLTAVAALLVGTAVCSSDEAPPATGDSGRTPGETPDPHMQTPGGPAAVGKLPPPVSGGTLLLLRDRRTAVVSDPDRDLVYVVDLAQRKITSTLTLEARAEPGRLVEDADGRVHVALRGEGVVLSLDPREGKALARRALCPAPRGLAFDSASKLLHVACAGGELVSIGALDETPARTLRLDRDLRDVLVDRDRLLVTTFRSAELLVVGDAGVTERLAPPRTQAVFRSFGRKAPPPGGVFPTGTSGADLSASPAVAWRLLPGPGGQAMVLHQRGVDTEIGTDPGSYADGVACTGIVESTMTAFEFGAERRVRSGAPLANAVLTVDMALSPNGKQVAVVAAGHAGTARQVLFYAVEDATAPSTPEKPCVPGAPAPVDPGADGMTPSEPDDPPPPIEYRPPNGEVIAVAFDAAGNVIVQSREPATLQILTQRAVPIVLSAERRADAGHQVFHGATRGMVACASCHPEGGEDGRTWRFFGLGSRRTQSLRGGIMDTAPFHWSGELLSLEHLMKDVFQGRMAGLQLDRDRVQALGRWMDAIPAIPTSKWHPPEAIARGKELFESGSVGCATCHRGPSFTNGASYDVGTGGIFQVPQLKNLAFRAPFMHDGCAATLADRFTSRCGGDDRHGVTSKLSAAQIQDLLAYLESL
jgi:mono/diheme cytochrome c family protein